MIIGDLVVPLIKISDGLVVSKEDDPFAIPLITPHALCCAAASIAKSSLKSMLYSGY